MGLFTALRASSICTPPGKECLVCLAHIHDSLKRLWWKSNWKQVVRRSVGLFCVQRSRHAIQSSTRKSRFTLNFDLLQMFDSISPEPVELFKTVIWPCSTPMRPYLSHLSRSCIHL